MRGLAALLLAATAGAGCTSEPCEGEGCPDVCRSDLCGDTDAPAASGGSAGSGAHAGSAGKGGNGNAISGPCSTDAACDTAHGFECLQGECRHSCRSHFDCAGRGTCEPLPGSAGNYCVLDTEPKPGEYYSHCPVGDECADGFLCLGAGPGDSDAYCSAACDSDDSCPSGLYCDDITGADGRPLSFCVRRNFCSPCESDSDCLAVPGQICAKDQSGAKICTQVCEPGVDACPWGNATVCGVWDSERGVATCAHRFGSCRGTGKGCEPCVRDRDCPTGFCHGSSFTGERWCVDGSVTCSCEDLESEDGICGGANECPRSPGNVSMLCFGRQRSADDPFAFHCFGADANGTSAFASPQTGCWAPL